MNIAQLIDHCVDALPVIAASAAPRKLVLAYSGGVDSEILAHGLAEFAKLHPQFDCQLVHVHHGLSVNADEWVLHCQAQAEIYQLPCTIARVKVKLAPRTSVEAEARSVRYEALLAQMCAADILMTAHHQDDQLETILLALKRGLGPKGLSAMGKVQSLDNDKWLIRPLLDLSKSDVEAYAKTRDIRHIQDESNFDEKYDRNFLRQSIIPTLKQRWSAIAATASRSAELCAMQQSVIDEELAARLPRIQTKLGGECVINLAALAQYSKAWQALLLRGHMGFLGFAPPSKVQAEQIIAQLLDAKVDANIEIKLTDVLIKRFKGTGYFLPMTASAHSANIAVSSLDELLEVGLNYGHNKLIQATLAINAGVRFPRADEKVTIEFSLPGSTRCQPQYRSKGRELKKLWQEFEVPPWTRSHVPLLCYNGKLVCAIGYWNEKAFLCAENETGINFKG
ncbi:tRNA lysidine(34) synthetase TilS [Shewanella sp. Choline-02u-19]|uniref:tRNA lysidine(34) synthetase TilS n=1 Tax=unclassified Shewanella TaxID=196818 RepID=UPI000C32A780|nr:MULTISPECIES: tRNA lysidine(34) synthetase TilS [unclassified Shewanella]PKH54945.1 tRNA lysidine(34) synthetase TilS [Shewanella sp. Bg11-22]PKI26717.1 tRNA lysidine(34) synthetase TilS [Shewanella sp. Choline-02u-19]